MFMSSEGMAVEYWLDTYSSFRTLEPAEDEGDPEKFAWVIPLRRSDSADEFVVGDERDAEKFGWVIPLNAVPDVSMDSIAVRVEVEFTPGGNQEWEQFHFSCNCDM